MAQENKVLLLKNLVTRLLYMVKVNKCTISNKNMRIERNQIRAIKGSKVDYRGYNFNAEILVNGKWIEPYLVDEEKLNWYDTNRRLYLYSESDEPVKEFLEIAFNTINDLLAIGYKLVGYEKYEEIIHRYHHPDEYVPNTIYLD